jgi:hypothetical protein
LNVADIHRPGADSQCLADFDHVVDELYVGSMWVSLKPEALSGAGVGAILKLHAGTIGNLEAFDVLALPFTDGLPIPDGYLRAGVDFLAERAAAGQSSLVMCAAGVSRSAAFALAYLTEQKGYDLRQAFTLLRDRRTVASPQSALWVSLLEFLDTPYTWNDVQTWLNQNGNGHRPNGSNGSNGSNGR